MCTAYMCERYKKWLVFSDEQCGYSFKESRRKEYECYMCKLEKVIEGERKERMEIMKKLMFQWLNQRKREKCQRKVRNRSQELERGGRQDREKYKK